MNSFRAGRAGDRLRDRAPGGGPRRRRAAAPGDPRLGRRRGATYRHAAQGGLATTTATSRSRTCRRSASTRPGSAEVRAGAAGAAGAPAGRATRRARAVGLRRGGHRADPTHDGRLRGDPAGRPGARRPRRSPTASRGDYARAAKATPSGRRTASSARAPASSSPTSSTRSSAGELVRPNAQEVLDEHLADRASRSARSSRRAASARSRTPARSLAIVDEVIADEPDGRRRLPGRQAAGDRLPRRPGHEGDPRPGQRGAGPGGASASASSRATPDAASWPDGPGQRAS